ncbi:MAG: hypothetical protein H6Q89_1948 [Myxococcaceae bacterium]|nr:hypothetical protein [Myxococcaceae bacterium]
MPQVSRVVVLALCFVALTWSTRAEAQDAPPDERGLEKIKQFMEITLANADINEAGKKLVAAKVVHVSKFDKNDPSKLNPDSLRFAYKKAHGNVKLYDVKVVRTVLTGTSAVGFGATGQKGKLFKYFIAKKEGVNGMPAPIQVFYPEDGSEPVVYDFGSF